MSQQPLTPGAPGGVPTPYPQWNGPDRRPMPRSGGAVAASVLIGLIVTPIAMAVLDIGLDRFYRRLETLQPLGAGAILALLVGMALLVLVAAAGRWSPVGPILAAVIWGAIPTVWELFAASSFFKLIYHLPKMPRGHVWFLTSAPVLFPVVTALLIGAAIAGARRR